MTIDEAIIFAEYAQIMAMDKPEVREFYKLAETALRAQLEREKNEPLTLDELRGMVGEAVLLETGEVSIREQLIAEWDILTDHDDDVFYFSRRLKGFSAKNYELTWLAYRRKPEPVSTVNADCKPKTNADRIRAIAEIEKENQHRTGGKET